MSAREFRRWATIDEAGELWAVHPNLPDARDAMKDAPLLGAGRLRLVRCTVIVQTRGRKGAKR